MAHALLARNGFALLLCCGLHADSAAQVLPFRLGSDALERPVRVQSPLGFSSGIKFDPTTGQIRATTNVFGHVTTYDYYPSAHLNAGRLYKRTELNGKASYFDYTARGEPQHEWGNVPYPAERKYSAFGELTNLVTFRTGSIWANTNWPGGSGDTTAWNYDTASGWLLSKADAQGRSTSFGYYTNGFDKIRTLSRGTTITSLYNALGDLSAVDYSDSTLDVTYTNYNRSGLARTVTDATGTHTLEYDHALRMIGDTCTAGAFSGLTVSSKFHKVFGRNRLSIHGASGAIQHDFDYDGYGRLAVATNDSYTAVYAYVPDSDLLQSVTGRCSGSDILTGTRTWEHGARLQGIDNRVGALPVSSHLYAYDSLNRRVRATQVDSSAWIYDYNDRNEVLTGKRVWSDQSPVSGQQFEYAYDPIGNRVSAKSGGDVYGANLRQAAYTANNLNQYTLVSTPGYEDILGAAWATNSVTVNSGIADRKVEYYHREISIANSSAAVWQSVSVTSGSTTTNLNLLFPPYQQSPVYDLNGNLLHEQVWTYVWDAENRLIQMWMTNVSGIPNASRKKLEFTYDHQGRRATKIVSTWNGSSFGSPVTTRFLYDGPKLVAELDGSTNLVRSYVWGLDLSGTTEEAGGIGGLLMVREHPSGACHFPAYDGNGNVMALVKTDLTTSARYEYGPFGELIRATGPLSRANPFRFSTKLTDDESELVYYGQRYYSPFLGRWLNRDPISEDGGLNLYAFVKNSPVNTFDALGMDGTLAEEEEAVGGAVGLESSGGAAQAVGFLMRVRNAVETFNDIQRFTADLMDAAHGDSTDLLIDLLSISTSTISQRLTGGAKLGIAATRGNPFEMHHIFPQRKDLARHFKAAGIDIHEWKVCLDRRVHKGIHQGGPRGGDWNADWAKFLKSSGKRPKTPQQMFDFAIELMQKYGINASEL